MTKREKEIIDLIKENPLITQEEIADKLNCARTSIAVHISNLMKKGIILGKKYIINEDPYILTMGETTVNIVGEAYKSIISNEVNPGAVSIKYGGIGKNIAENISKLGVSSNFITVLGGDSYGKEIENYLESKNINISDSIFLKNNKTTMSVSILNNNKEKEISISSSDICKNITPMYLNSIKKKITNARLVVLDANLDETTLSHIAYLRKKPNLLVYTVSPSNALKIKEFVGKFHTVKCNDLEAEILTGIRIYGNDDLRRIGEFLIKKGIKRVFIYIEEKGVFFMDEHNNSGIIPLPDLNLPILIGSKEALVAGIAYAECNDYDIEYSTKFGIGAFMLNLLNDKNMTEYINVKNIENIIKEANI